MSFSKRCTELKSSQWDRGLLGSVWFWAPDHVLTVFSISWVANLIFIHIAFPGHHWQPLSCEDISRGWVTFQLFLLQSSEYTTRYWTAFYEWKWLLVHLWSMTDCSDANTIEILTFDPNATVFPATGNPLFSWKAEELWGKSRLRHTEGSGGRVCWKNNH